MADQIFFPTIGIVNLTSAAQNLVRDLSGMEFAPPVSLFYNPLEYAWDNHCQFLERYGSGTKRILFLGMNPGPWGMAQTGVPFGEIPAVRDWMGLDGAIGKPATEHPKRPIEGFNCTRSEVSGKRLWGLFSERFETAEHFFSEHFVVNYCPLVWMSETGANITPDKLPKEVMKPIEDACNRHLAHVITHLKPEWLVGVGGFAEKRLIDLVKNTSFPNLPKVGKVLHPSPASPAANRGWAAAASKQLEAQGIWDSLGESK